MSYESFLVSNYLMKMFENGFFTANVPKANPAGNYMSKVNNRNSRTRCEICSKSTTKKPSGVFIVNFEHILHHVLVFLLLTLSR